MSADFTGFERHRSLEFSGGTRPASTDPTGLIAADRVGTPTEWQVLDIRDREQTVTVETLSTGWASIALIARKPVVQRLATRFRDVAGAPVNGFHLATDPPTGESAGQTVRDHRRRIG